MERLENPRQVLHTRLLALPPVLVTRIELTGGPVGPSPLLLRLATSNPSAVYYCSVCIYKEAQDIHIFFMKIFSLDRHFSYKSSKGSDWVILSNFGHLIPQFFMIA